MSVNASQQVKRLADLATIERDGIAPGSIKSGTLSVGLENITGDGEFSGVGPVEAGQLASTKFSFSSKHLLYGKLRPYLRKIARPDFDGICSTDILPILPSPEIDRNFLFHYLRQDVMIAKANSLTAGANLPRLSPRSLAEFPIPLLPLAEQQRIAAILDRAESLRAKRRQSIDKLETLVRSLFLDLFGNPVLNTRQWPLRRFDDIGELDRGISKNRPRNSPELLGGPYPLIQTGDIANSDGYIRSYTNTYSELGLKQSKMWPAGTMCITIAANIGRTAILTFDACFPDSVVGFRANETVRTEYIQTWLSFLQKKLEDNAPQVAQKNLNLATLRALDVPLPPIELQNEFVRRVNAAVELRRRQNASLAKLDKLFASLQHRAFRGEL